MFHHESRKAIYFGVHGLKLKVTRHKASGVWVFSLLWLPACSSCRHRHECWSDQVSRWFSLFSVLWRRWLGRNWMCICAFYLRINLLVKELGTCIQEPTQMESLPCLLQCFDAVGWITGRTSSPKPAVCIPKISFLEHVEEENRGGTGGPRLSWVGIAPRLTWPDLSLI